MLNLLTAVLLSTQNVSTTAPLVADNGCFMPRGVTSFGAARHGQWLYVFGGHTGKPHDYCREEVVGSFWRLSLLDLTSWEELPPAEPAQGTALVSDGKHLIRVGGMAAHNARGEPSDLRSQSDVQRFDPRTRKWEALTPLPEPRSSHDACVVDGKLYVVGGWTLAAGDETWLDTALVADLAQPELTWREIARPSFRRRGIALAPIGSRVAVIGGMDEEGEMLGDVALYDPARDTWSAAPSLPKLAFGAAACESAGRLLVSAKDGVLYELDENAGAWRERDRFLVPRLFHRQVALDDGRIVAIGGAAAGARARVVEVFDAAARAQPRIDQWLIPFPGPQKNREGAFFANGALHLFGGNSGLEQHDFRPERFVADGWKLSLADLDARPLAPFPVRRQSMVTLCEAAGKIAWAIGGFGFEDDVARACDEVFRYDIKADSWSLAGRLPEPRTQFGLTEHDGKLWVFGGMDYDPRRKAQGDSFRYTSAVVALDLGAPDRGFVPTGIELPGPRRAFASAQLGGRFYLIGGMREAFELVERCDVFDFASATWSTIPAPARPRISPELAVLDGRLYLLGGSSPGEGKDTVPNTSLEVFDPASGWRTLIDQVPGLTNHARMFVANGALFVWCGHQEQEGAARLLAIRTGNPEVAQAQVVEAAAKNE